LRQKLGQHFLASDATLVRIADLICRHADGRILEIGPGRGALTRKLIERSRAVTAIEIDSALALQLRTEFASVPNLEIVSGDAMDFDFRQWNVGLVAGNLPYYVATPLIEKTVRAGLPGVFLIQKEVAQRLAAGPGSRDYGFLSCTTQLFSDPVLVFTVAPGAFRPPPKVDSAVVQLTPADRSRELGIGDPEAFLKFLSACFRQKRKTLRNNLREAPSIASQPEAGLRAEQLSLAQFADLWRRLQ
jgi:16S rRNA (adenine1518-N6/adenine1519-N6)-dimethyltransferase